MFKITKKLAILTLLCGMTGGILMTSPPKPSVHAAMYKAPDGNKANIPAPAKNSNISDYAHILTPEAIKKMQKKSLFLQNETAQGPVIKVVTVKNTNVITDYSNVSPSQDIDLYSLVLSENPKWNIGFPKGFTNQIIMVIGKENGNYKLNIEVGSDLSLLFNSNDINTQENEAIGALGSANSKKDISKVVTDNFDSLASTLTKYYAYGDNEIASSQDDYQQAHSSNIMNSINIYVPMVLEGIVLGGGILLFGSALPRQKYTHTGFGYGRNRRRGGGGGGSLFDNLFGGGSGGSSGSI